MHRAVRIHDVEDWQLVAVADFKVGLVVGGGDLENARAEGGFDVGVAHNRDEPLGAGGFRREGAHGV